MEANDQNKHQKQNMKNFFIDGRAEPKNTTELSFDAASIICRLKDVRCFLQMNIFGEDV